MAEPHHEVWPRGWQFTETVDVIGLKEDCFCIDKRFHIHVSNGLPGIPDAGWHVSVKLTCDHRAGDPVADSVWMPQVKRFFREAKAWGYIGPFPSPLVPDVLHFHEDLSLRRKRN